MAQRRDARPCGLVDGETTVLSSISFSNNNHVGAVYAAECIAGVCANGVTDLTGQPLASVLSTFATGNQ
jgi:hypothetical protein